MKNFLSCFFILLATVARAQTPATSTGSSDVPVTITSPNSSINFSLEWRCPDLPAFSGPGQLELRDAANRVVGRVSGTVHRTTGPSVSVSGNGTVGNFTNAVIQYAHSGTPANGRLLGTWNLTGLVPGAYTVRLLEFANYNAGARHITVWITSGISAVYATPGLNQAPTIQWSTAPTDTNSGEAYNISAHGQDADGNLAQVNVWKNGAPFAFAGGGDGTNGDSGNWTSDGGPQTVTFTAQAVDTDGVTSPTIFHTVTINGPANRPPTVELAAPDAQTITAGTALAISSRATDPDGNLSSHNLDIQRPDGAWNYEGGFANGEPYQGGPVGSSGNSTRIARFTFTDVGTYQVRSAASDGSGWYHSATVAITVVAPPPVQFALATSAGTGGTVSPGGTYNVGTTVVISASPDAAHDFAGWSGDASGVANPLSVLVDRAKGIRANFVSKNFTLVTVASGGGNVTPGGNYPIGTTVTITATPDATHRFVGWSGDATGSLPVIAVTLDRALSVQAVFESKTAQSINFPSIADQTTGSAIPLAVTASSGLPVTLIVSGPATYAGGVLTLTGPGPVSVQATQPGDDSYLPAAPVTRTFNATTSVVLRYRGVGRTFLQTGRTPESIPYVIQTNP